MTPEADHLARQLLQLQDLHRNAALSEAAYDEARLRLERQLVDALLAEHAAAGAALPSAAPVAPVASAASAAPAGTAAVPAPAAVSGGSGRRLLALAGGAVLLLAAAGYAWQGSASQWLFGSAVPVDGPVDAGGAAPHATSADQIGAMVDKLAQRLQAEPADGEGWAMLGRSYAMLGRHADAVAAYAKAQPLLGEDARLLADHADALAMKNGRRVAGEPIALVRRALKLEPDNLKALSLAGTEAFDRQAYTEALQHWERIVRVGSPDDERVQQIAGSIAEARRLAGLPTAATPGPTPTPAPATPAAVAPANPTANPSSNTTANAAASVSGTVTLAPALAARVQPTDTVFVFARAASGAPMPLAILRQRADALPLRFTLDDSLAMAPSAKISGATQLMVGARISRSGQAQPQPGDLIAPPQPAHLGASGLRLQISEAVKAP